MRLHTTYLTEDPTPPAPVTVAPPQELPNTEELAQLKVQVEQLKAQLNFAREALAIIAPGASLEQQQEQAEAQAQQNRKEKLSNIYKTIGV